MYDRIFDLLDQKMLMLFSYEKRKKNSLSIFLPRVGRKLIQNFVFIREQYEDLVKQIKKKSVIYTLNEQGILEALIIIIIIII